MEYLTKNKAQWKNRRHVIYLLALMVKDNEAVKTYIDSYKNIVRETFPTFIISCKGMSNTQTEKAELEFIIEVFSELFAFIEPVEDVGDQL